jgi:ElaB/YqjD/DUF883 family membrane-anchored ribosome-binding protein
MSTREMEAGTNEQGLREQVQNLRKDMEVQAATEAGAHATQVATHAGTWSAIIAGAGGLVIGIFLGLAIARS